jgi:hypothetical protein
MREAIDVAIASSDVVQSFLTEFPESNVSLLQWGSSSGCGLDVVAVPFGRYQLTLQVPLRKNDLDDPEIAGPPSFTIVERSEVTMSSEGRELAISYAADGAFPPHFDEAAWWRFARGKQDWSAFGIQEVKRTPARIVYE